MDCLTLFEFRRRVRRDLLKNIPEIDEIWVDSISPYEDLARFNIGIQLENGKKIEKVFTVSEIYEDYADNIHIHYSDFIAEVLFKFKSCPTTEESSDVGVKFDDGKLRMDLITPEMLTGVAEVLTMGSKKYGDRNWENGIDLDRLYAAALRHLTLWRSGQDLDDESGLHHVKHAAVNLLMAVTFIERGKK